VAALVLPTCIASITAAAAMPAAARENEVDFLILQTPQAAKTMAERAMAQSAPISPDPETARIPGAWRRPAIGLGSKPTRRAGMSMRQCGSPPFSRGPAASE
jgi:hypothetical protein